MGILKNEVIHIKEDSEVQVTEHLDTCPFCKGCAYIREFRMFDVRWGYQGVCKSCGVTTAICDTPEAAVRLWNTRK